MNVEYSRRAVADLEKISIDVRAFGPAVAAAISARLQAVVARIAENLDSGRPVAQRPGVRVILVRRYPYKIFYRVLDRRVRILHIRHTARRPWLPRA